MTLSFVYPAYLWLLLLVPLTVALGLVGRRAVQFSASTMPGLREKRTRLWSGLALRAFLLLAIIFALAGIQFRWPSNALTTVFILDASDSIPPAEIQRGEDFIRQAVESMPKQGGENQAAVIVFGESALVERLPSSAEFLAEISSIPITTRTDIASALQLAQAILPSEGAKRLVLLSDGRQNLGQAVEQAELAASSQVELLYVPLGGPEGEVEVLVDHMEAPAEVRQGQTISLRITVQSSAQVNATLRVFEDNATVHSQDILLQPGISILTIDIPTAGGGDKTGFHRFRAQILPYVDTRLQNNEASAFTVVHGPPAILLVEGSPGEGENLKRALEAADMTVTALSPADMPTTLGELAAYQAVILVNAHAAALPSGVMETLRVYVGDLGMGLLMVGGDESFGAGGYLRTPLEKALPVDMEVRDKDLQANLALVVVVDKSGSMGRCHCDNPDLNQTYTRAEVGQPKVDIAKEAVMRASSALGSQDYLGVVAFDSSPHWVLELARLLDPTALERAIATFQAEGQTNMQAGVFAAYQALSNVQARRKHIILMTDGWVRTGDLSALAQQMKDQGVTLSVVAAGGGSAEYLAGLAQLGGGTYYPATDVFHVPDIFLKETVKSAGRYIIEEPFYPLPNPGAQLLSGLDAMDLPPLLGYNGSTAKNTARLELLTPRGDPLLATWQYGMGRSAVWTSDFKAQWATSWIKWDDFPRFAAQLVGSILPAPKVEGLETAVSLEEGQAIVHLQAVDAGGEPLNFLSGALTIIDPDLEKIETPLKQVGAGEYQASSKVSKPGTYLLRLGINQGDQSLGQVALGLVVPYSPEYKASGIDLSFLTTLSHIASGELPAAGAAPVSPNPGQLSDPAAAFAHNLPAVANAREIWQLLLLLAALLFPLDVAIRRLALNRQDLQKASRYIKERVTEHLPGGAGPVLEQPRLLGQLFQARERARRTGAHNQPPAPGLPPDTGAPLQPGVHPESDSPPQASTRETPPPSTPPVSPAPPSTPGEAPADSLARLREAKKRARQREKGTVDKDNGKQ